MKVFHFLSVSALLLGSGISLQAQPDSLGLNGYDTLKVNLLPEVSVTALPDLSVDEDRSRYYILRRKVLKVWPYAKEATEQLYAMEAALEGEHRRRKRKKYARQIAHYLEDHFKDDLKELTRSEGVLLVKLINRETKRTTHEIIKEYRGGINALFWQTMARVYDNDLKYEFDPEHNREDAWIGNILIRAFEAGMISRPEIPETPDAG